MTVTLPESEVSGPNSIPQASGDPITVNLAAPNWFRSAAVAVCGTLFALSLKSQTEFHTHSKPILPSNADSCASCHSTPSTGGSSKVIVTRVQHSNNGGKLTNSQVLHSIGQVAVVPNEGVRGDRLTISLMGDGYIEAVDENEIQVALQRQHRGNGKILGKVARAPALEAASAQSAIGKFGWKAQHSSLRSACADSMLNELGVPNRLYPANDTPRTEDDAALERIVTFVRSLPPPERDHDLAATDESLKGEGTFSRIGCALCHVPTMKTLPAGTPINGGTYRIPVQIGGQEIHPYSDLLLHDVDTGDGIVEAATAQFVDPSTAESVSYTSAVGFTLSQLVDA